MIRPLLVLSLLSCAGCATLLDLGDEKAPRADSTATPPTDGAADTVDVFGETAVDASDTGDVGTLKPALLLYSRPPSEFASGRVAVTAVDTAGKVHVLRDGAGYNAWSHIVLSGDFLYFHDWSRSGQTVARLIDDSIVDLLVPDEPDHRWDSVQALPDQRYLVYQRRGYFRAMLYDSAERRLKNEFESDVGTDNWGLSAATFSGLLLYGRVGIDDAWIGRYYPKAPGLSGARVVPFGSFITAAAVGEGFVVADPSAGSARHFDESRVGRPVVGLPLADFHGFVGLRDGRLVVYRGDVLEVGSLVDDGKGGFQWKLQAANEAPKSAPRWNTLTAL